MPKGRLNGCKTTSTQPHSSQNPVRKPNGKKGHSNSRDSDDEDLYDATVNYQPFDEKVTIGLQYILMASSNFLPVKRADIAKVVDTKNPTLFRQVIERIQNEFKVIFGIQMYGLNAMELASDLTGSGLSCYIVCSTFRQIPMPDISTEPREITQYNDTVRAVLFILLTVIYMEDASLENGMKETTIWMLIKRLNFDRLLRIGEFDLARFLKVEYVNKLYLRVVDTADEAFVTGKLNSYFWGPRAQVEYNKLDILLFTAKTLGRNPTIFTTQANSILRASDSESERASRIFETIGSGNDETDDDEVADDIPGPSSQTPDSEAESC